MTMTIPQRTLADIIANPTQRSPFDQAQARLVMMRIRLDLADLLQVEVGQFR